MSIQEYKDRYVRHISDEQMADLINLLSSLLNRSFVIYYEQTIIIGGKTCIELLGYYISNAGHQLGSIFIAGQCGKCNEFSVMSLFDLSAHLKTISYMKENGFWMVSPIVDSNILPDSVIGAELGEFNCNNLFFLI